MSRVVASLDSKCLFLKAFGDQWTQNLLTSLRTLQSRQMAEVLHATDNQLTDELCTPACPPGTATQETNAGTIAMASQSVMPATLQNWSPTATANSCNLGAFISSVQLVFREPLLINTHNFGFQYIVQLVQHIK